MASAIDATKPVTGSATTSAVRANFAAAEAEIDELHRATEDSVTAAGTVDALTANFTRDVVLAEGVTVVVKAAGANTSTTPTLNVDATGVRTIVKDSGSPLAAGDIAGARHFCIFRYDLANTVWVLMNPAINSSSISHDSTTGFVANEHIDHSGVSVTAGVGLSGGGTIVANRTLALDINGLTTDASPNTTTDYIPYYDTSEGAPNKALIKDLIAVSQSLVTSGYIELAGGLIVNWGRRSHGANTTFVNTLSKAYTTAHLFCTSSYEGADINNGAASGSERTSLTTIKTSNGDGASRVVTWLSIGY